MSVIAIIITFPYTEDDNEIDTKGKEEKIIDNNNNKGSLKEAFFSKKNLMIISFCFCGFCKYNIL